MRIVYYFDDEPFYYDIGYGEEYEAAKELNAEDPDSVSEGDIIDYLTDKYYAEAEEAYKDHLAYKKDVYSYNGVRRSAFF